MSGSDDGDDACSSSERREEDEQLLAALRATEFGERAFNDLVTHLVRYATGVLRKMVRDEEIWAELAKIKRPRTRPTHWNEWDKEQLVSDSVTDAFYDFYRKVIKGDSWDPSRASLKTLFVHYCLRQFADCYEAWQGKSLARIRQKMVQRDPDFLGPRQAPSAEHVAMIKQAVAELSPERFARSLGYSHKEIGQKLGISDRAVEGRLYRDRGKTLRTDMGEKGGHDRGSPTA